MLRFTFSLNLKSLFSAVQRASKYNNNVNTLRHLVIKKEYLKKNSKTNAVELEKLSKTNIAKL